VKVGDLVRHTTGDMGIVQRIDYQHYGSRQAFKTYPVSRGHAIRDVRKPDFIAKTKKGIEDRVLVLFSSRDEPCYSYVPSTSLEVISESR